MFVGGPGNDHLYWATSIGSRKDLGAWAWKIGGNRNVQLFPPRLISKGGIEATYKLSATEASMFRRAWGFDFNWNPVQWWKGAFGQYYFRPGSVTWARRVGQLGQAVGIAGTVGVATWGILELQDRW